METVAVLVDGGFYQKKAQQFWGKKNAEDRTKELWNYCLSHVSESYGIPGHNKLYRIFYYDCPPSTKRVYHPILKEAKDLGKSELYHWMTSFHDAMRNTRKVALRFGELSEIDLEYVLPPKILRAILNGSRDLTSLTEDDFRLSIAQKGVDMRIGLDVASMAYKRLVTRMVLISGDSDFVPVAKHARREGIDFILDPMWNHVKESLREHVGGIKTFAPRPSQDTSRKRDE